MTLPTPKRADYCLATVAAAARPRPARTVSQWADAHRQLTGKQSGERGTWRTERTPYLREIMDCFSSTSRVHDVVVIKSAQVGVTEACINILGYTIDHAPVPAMVLMPTLEGRDAWKVQKLNPLFTDTTVIRELLGGIRSRDAANRADVIDFPGGVLFLSGGNSPNSYAQRSVALLILDDLDRFPPEIGEEGDPIALAKNRTKTFARKRHLFISTPTNEDTSLIWREYQDTDRRRYHVPCPHCSLTQPLEWGGKDTVHGVKWNDSVSSAWYVCVHCHGEIREHHKPAMLAGGTWVAEDPDHERRGYHISELYAPIGLGATWLELAIDWQDASKNPGKLKTFLNTRLGEVWKHTGDRVDPTGLLTRREAYPENLPRLARTAGVDVQKDRIEITIDDWGVGEENWTVDHIILPGDTAQPDVWADLETICREFEPEAVGVDSGYNTSNVYAFVRPRRWAFALKGIEGPGRPIVEDEKIRRQKYRRKTKKGVIVNLVGGDQAKALIYSRLKQLVPGPGYIHFPADPAFDDEYFQQLTAERLEPKMRGSRPHLVWIQTRARNEALDCKQYSLAALRLANIDLKARAIANASRVAVAVAAGLAPPAASVTPAGSRGISLAAWRRA